TTIAGLNFVEHQQPAMFIANCAQLVKVIRRRNPHAAFALHWLNQHSNDICMSLSGSAYSGYIVVGYAYKTFDQWLETDLYFGVAGGAQGREGAAVKAVAHHD